MHRDRAGYITIIVALTVTVLGLLGFQYYAAYFAPVPVRLQEGPVRNMESSKALTAGPASTPSHAQIPPPHRSS
jgi:hypothetical protein